MAFITLPSIFQNPYAVNAPPDKCCCGTGNTGVNIVLNPVQTGFTPGVGVVTRPAQAAQIIAAANAKGFAVFQGN